MKKPLVQFAWLLMPALLLVCSQAAANGTLTATLTDYNSAQVVANGYVVTVPNGSTIGGVYYGDVYTLTTGTSLEAGSHFTITLPTGLEFNTTPSLCFYAAGVCASGASTLYSGGAGFSTADFSITSTLMASSGKLYIFPAFKLLNTNHALGTQFGGGSFSLSVQATGNVTAANNDPSPVSQPAFTHAVGSLPDTITPGSGQITLANPYYGDQFVASGSTVADSGLVAVFAINTELNDPFNSNVPVLTPFGTANALAPTDTTNITIDGSFNGIGLAYANTNTSGACQGSIPSGAGVYTGTATNNSISFTGIPINTPVEICMIPFGVMWASDVPFNYTYSQGAGVTDYFGGLSQTTAGNFYTYQAAPTTVVQVLGGSPQTATIGSGFCAPLAVNVYDSSTAYELKGIDVVFEVPSSGQSGTFVGSATVQPTYRGALAATNTNGIAVASLVANSTAGIYTVTANVGSVQAPFGLTNEPGVSSYIFCNGFEY